jgi:hypothetical protein
VYKKNEVASMKWDKEVTFFQKVYTSGIITITWAVLLDDSTQHTFSMNALKNAHILFNSTLVLLLPQYQWIQFFCYGAMLIPVPFLRPEHSNFGSDPDFR